MNTLATRLAQALKARNKTPAELARATGKTESAVSQWLSGETKSLRSDSLMATCALLSCNAQWLASGKGLSGLEPIDKRLDQGDALDIKSFPNFIAASNYIMSSPEIGPSQESRLEFARSVFADPTHSSEITFASDKVVQIAAHMGSKNKPDEIVIPQFDTGGAMGSGLILRDQPGVIRGWTVSQEWINKNIKSHSGAANLCIVTGFGDSMKGMFNSGDPLVIDSGVKSVDYDAVYFFRVADEGFIKRLQRIPGQGLVVLSQNDAYKDWVIDKSMDFEVFGRVVKAWQGEDF